MPLSDYYSTCGNGLRIIKDFYSSIKRCLTDDYMHTEFKFVIYNIEPIQHLHSIR